MLKQLLKMIKRNTSKFFIFSVCLFLLVNKLAGQTVSPFNKLPLADTSGNYSFIVSGHFHGESSNLSTFPASTLLAGIDTLNSIRSSFMISLGDMFIDLNETYVSNYKKSLFSKLNMPIFNAVGNHDLSNNNFYEKVYGKTYYSFSVGSELYIFLNTEINDGSIKNEQLEFFKKALAEAQSEKVKNIFIFSHRPVWAENNATYEGLFKGNSRTLIGENNFEEDIKPLLVVFPKYKQVYWISGSLANGPVSFFYNKEPDSKILFMQTAIRDLPRDAVLQIDVKDGTVSLKGISLTGQSLEPIETYNLDYWKQRVDVEEPFNYRLLPLLIMQMLLHHYFWIGFVSSVLLLLLLSFLYNRWKKRG
jgi:Calcineurin-like phosphoesterase